MKKLFHKCDPLGLPQNPLLPSPQTLHVALSHHLPHLTFQRQEFLSSHSKSRLFRYQILTPYLFWRPKCRPAPQSAHFHQTYSTSILFPSGSPPHLIILIQQPTHLTPNNLFHICLYHLIHCSPNSIPLCLQRIPLI